MVAAMSERLCWFRRHPVLTIALVLLGAVLAVALFVAGRAALVFLSIEPRAEYWQEQARLPGEVTYVALGDSLSQGIGSSSPETSFVSVLGDDLAADTDEQVRVVNLSVTGATVEELLADQLPAFETLLADLAASGEEPALVTLVIGANDAGDTTPEAFRNDLEVVLDAMPAGTLVGDVPDFNGGDRQQPAAGLAEVIREEVTERDDLVLVPVEAGTGGQSLDEYAADFFHPSDLGYERYIDVFRASIDEVAP